MSDEQDKLKVSLEPPKLFGRKKKSDAPASKRTPNAPSVPGPSEAVAEDVDGTVEADASDETAVIESPAEEPSDDTAVIDPPVEDPPVEAEPEPAAVPAPTPAPRKAAQKATRPPAAKKPAPAAKTAPKVEDKPAEEPAAPAAKKTSRPRAKLAPPIEPEPVKDTDLEDAAIVEHDEGPLLAMYPAAAVTGVVVGGVMVLLTWLSLRGCEAVRGTSSCGGGPGFVLLVATFVLCILLGSTLLKVFSIPDPGSSSFLAVGLVAVVALLFLIDALDNWSMIIVIPLLAIGAYLASVWVTKTFVEPTDIDAS